MLASYGGSHVTLVGPWGGQTGSRWDDGVYSGVRQIVISTSSDGVHSIQFEYDKSGHAFWSHKYGGHSGASTHQIRLDYPTQFLVSVSGYHGSITEGGPVIVRSLSLETNKGKYGPYGIEQGVPFLLPTNDGMLVGFHGWSSTYLDSIGVYVKSILHTKHLELQKRIPGLIDGNTSVGSSKRVLSVGPWGGYGGTTFDDGIYTGVREVHIKRSGGLVSLRVCYDQYGRTVWAKKNGGTGGLKLDKIVFDYPFEVLTHITGYYRSMIFRGPTVVKSITFHTNKRSYGPFGDEQGFSFTSGPSGPIVGFHGRNGYFVDSIGVHVLETKPPFLPQPFDISNQESSEVVWGLPRQMLYESGPWGGERGTKWDDGIYSGVKKVILSRGDAICSIQVQYDQNGNSVWSSSRGIINDACAYQIKFNYPYEVLTCISGYYDTMVGDMQRKVIRSLTFHTNRERYGPYGKTTGTYFSTAMNNIEGKVVGLYGRSGTFLDAIGVHMQHWVHKSYK